MDKIDYLHPTAIAQIQAVLNGEPVPDNTDNRDGRVKDVRYLTPYAVEQIIEAGGSGASSADRVSYDNTESGLTATDVQGAIDETLDKVDAMSAAKVSYDNSTSGLTATTVQSAIDEVGANLGEITPKVDSLMDRADLVSVQAEKVGYGTNNVGKTLDDLQQQLTTLNKEVVVEPIWEDRGESGRIWAIFTLPYEVIEDTTVSLNKNAYNIDKRRLYDKDGVLVGGYGYETPVKEFLIKKGTKKIEIQYRSQQTAVNMSVTAKFGINEDGVIYEKIGISEAGIYVASNNCGVVKKAVEGGKYYVMQCNQGSTGYRDFFARFYQADNTLISTETFAKKTERGYRVNWKGWRFQTPQNTAYMVMTAYNWDGVSVDDVDIFIKEDSEFLSNENPYTYGFENVWIFGDSITATGYGSYDFAIFEERGDNGQITRNANGGYLPYLFNNCYIRPKRFAKWAIGGQTLSDINTPFSGSYISQMETAISYYDANQIQAPDVIFIVGCTNDFDQATKRYVTNEELSGADYDEYCESQFMTSGSGYGNYTLIDKDTINKGKIIGAIRYMVEVLGTKFPNARFCVIAPPHSTKHNPINQKRCVRDMEWICERLSIPFINVFKYSNMPCLWDFGDNHRYLSDGVHPFFVDGNPRTGVKAQGMFIAREFNRFFADKL